MKSDKKIRKAIKTLEGLTLTQKELAKAMGKTERMVRIYDSSGKVKHYNIKSNVLYDKEEAK